MERHRASMRALISSVAIVLCLPATAAATPPELLTGPEISGVPAVGSTLTASATWTGDPDPTVTWTWLRCQNRGASTCSDEPAGTEQDYVVQALDAGAFLRVRVTISNGVPPDVSELSDPLPVPARAPEPEPSTEPAPSPVPTLTPTVAPSPVPEPVGLAPADGSPLQLLTPFPVVRIKGVLTATGARVTLFTVRAARGVRIVVRCRGTTCSRRRWARKASRLTHLRPYERALAAGTRITVLVTAPRRIGKHTLIVIRQGRAPWRRDRCVMPGTSRPFRCPESSA